MKPILRSILALTTVIVATQATAQITLYQQDRFEGRSFTATQKVGNLERFGFNDRASSIYVQRDRWEVCEGAQFDGRCVVVRPGRYPDIAALGLNNRVSSVRPVAANARIEPARFAPAPVSPRVVFFERPGFEGPSFTTERQVADFSRFGFNNRASSAIVVGTRWEVCSSAGFGGRCTVLRPGRYPTFASMGLNNAVTSVREVSATARIDDNRFAPPPPPYAFTRRPEERLYEAPVQSVRAVVGPPEQRCWVEREKVAQPQSNVNIPGALVGAVIGGVLGHQVGGGTGKDLATAGGAVAGAAIGANVGTGGQQTVKQDVRHCTTVPSQSKPEYWDVTYEFRGQSHRVQMIAPPGPTVTVNEQGEPRA